MLALGIVRVNRSLTAFVLTSHDLTRLFLMLACSPEYCKTKGKALGTRLTPGAGYCCSMKFLKQLTHRSKFLFFSRGNLPFSDQIIFFPCAFLYPPSLFFFSKAQKLVCYILGLWHIFSFNQIQTPYNSLVSAETGSEWNCKRKPCISFIFRS